MSADKAQRKLLGDGWYIEEDSALPPEPPNFALRDELTSVQLACKRLLNWIRARAKARRS